MLTLLPLRSDRRGPDRSSRARRAANSKGFPSRIFAMPNYLREIRRQVNNVRVNVRVQRAFGRRLRATRTEQGYSRKQLAREAKCSWLFLACCEHGLAAPRLLTLVSLSHALDTDSGDLAQGLGQDYEFRDE